jgi:hypothetical protein
VPTRKETRDIEVKSFLDFKMLSRAGCLWLTPIILPPQEVEIRRIEV